MNLHNYKKASDREVRKWIEQSMPEITEYQKSELHHREIISHSPFEFMVRRKRVPNFWLRISLIVMPFVWIILMLFLPFKFLISGSWGYSYRHINWYSQWRVNAGLV